MCSPSLPLPSHSASPFDIKETDKNPPPDVWPTYLVAAVSTVLCLGFRIALSASEAEQRSLLILLLLPIMLSAYIGGIGPGLVATTIAALGANPFFHSPSGNVWLSRPLDLMQWTILIMVGVLISVMTEALLRARRRDRETIAKLREAKRRLRISTQEAGELRTALDEHAIVAITDSRGKITFVNDKFCAISGYSRDELIGQDHRIINSGCHPKEFFLDLWSSIRAGKVWHGEIKNRAKDGSFYWVDTTLMPFLDSQGLPRQYIAIRADITEKKLGELALRASEQRFRTTLDNLMEGCQIMGHDWVYLYINAAAAGHNRRPAESMIGRTIMECFPGIESTEVFAVMRSCMRGGPADELETELVYPDGSKAWFHLLIQSVPEGVFILSVDVTERREADAVVRRQQEELRVLFDLLPAFIWFKDTENRHLRVNQRAADAVGKPVAEIEGRPCADIYPEQAQRFYADDLEVIRTKKPKLGIVERLPDVTGRERWMQTDKVPYCDVDGNVVGIVVAAQDITERREAEEALRLSEERFRQLAENINEVFWMYDPAAGRILYVSPAYETIWGRSCEELLRDPRNWLDAIHPEDIERVSAAMLARMSTGGYDETYRVERPDGSLRWVHDRGFPVRDETGRIYRLVGTAEDITERHQLQTQFFQAQKMEAIGTLAGGIAHDFNNILGGIIGYTELARIRVKDNPGTREYLDAVLQAAHRAVDLVKQILAFSRRREQEQSIVQLRHLVAESMKLLRATVPSTIEFELTLDADVAPVRADPSQIHQVVLNLCTNAAQAMRGHPGRLDVRLENHFVDETLAATLPPLYAGPHVLLTISDTGCGIAPETLGRIFEPFFTTKPPGEGTGLGLSVVHGIVRSHEGAIAVQSLPGQGTRFQVYLPAQTDLPREKPAGPERPPKGRGERVLLVDDEPPLALLGLNMLEELGYRPTTSTRPEEVLERMSREPDAFDLVITDLTMPGMTGLALARALLRLRPGLPVILVTGYSASLTVEQVREEGLSDMVSKPFTVQMLGHAIHRALHPTIAGAPDCRD